EYFLLSSGVLSHLSLLEVQARSRKSRLQQPSRVKELKAKVEALRVQRDQLTAEIDTHKMFLLIPSLNITAVCPNPVPPLSLTLSYLSLGGYNVIKTSQGKGLCASLTTAYEGVYLETYNVEIDLKPRLRISRHNVPPFIPLSSLAEQSNMQTDIRSFLDTLSKHLNAFAGRKQQLKLVKELHKSVEVLESNVLCSVLVMLLTLPGEKSTVLCTLNYTDHTRLLPSGVHFEYKALPDAPEWKKNCSLLMETPVHKALMTMKKNETIL
uniref:Centromere protein O n=1 Tax=Labrus bergylta TaxID=56723 RepID=A0A3Q3EEL8_9LABR